MKVQWQVVGGEVMQKQVADAKLKEFKSELRAACKLLGTGFAISPTPLKEKSNAEAAKELEKRRAKKKATAAKSKK